MIAMGFNTGCVMAEEGTVDNDVAISSTVDDEVNTSDSKNTSTEENDSRWEADQPERLVTSETIIDEHNVEYELSYW